MQDRHDSEIKKLEGQIKNLKDQIQNLLKQLSDLEEAKQGVEQQLHYTESLIKGMEDKVAEAKARMEKSLFEHQ
jgi:predicted  nucleic acid-binding Zn-ribbon protein